MELTNSKFKDSHWKVFKELQDKFGDDTEAMMAVLPKRKHPQNPRVLQWLVLDDRSRLAATHFKKSQLSGSIKVDQAQGKALKDAFGEITMDESMMEQLENSHKDMELDSKIEELDVQELPPWIKKISDACSKTSEKGKKVSMEDKFRLEEGDAGFDKLTKLESLVRKLLTACQSEEFASKSSKYKVDGKLKKDFLACKTDLKALEEEVHMAIVKKSASKKKVQDMLIRGCQLYKVGDDLLKKVLALNKGT